MKELMVNEVKFFPAPTELNYAETLKVSGGSVGDYWGVGEGLVGGEDTECSRGMTLGAVGGAIGCATGGLKTALLCALGGMIAGSAACGP